MGWVWMRNRFGSIARKDVFVHTDGRPRIKCGEIRVTSYRVRHEQFGILKSMITHASFRNFKALRSVDIDLQRLTVIVGPNGSGKTSILEGLELVALATVVESQKELWQNREPSQFLHSGENAYLITIQGDWPERFQKIVLEVEEKKQTPTKAEIMRLAVAGSLLQKGLTQKTPQWIYGIWTEKFTRKTSLRFMRPLCFVLI